MGERVHCLKTWGSFFEAIAEGRKRFELRVNDRDFAVGDILRLVEWNPIRFVVGGATGRVLHVRVTYLVEGVFGLPHRLCVMSIDLIDSEPRYASEPFNADT